MKKTKMIVVDTADGTVTIKVGVPIPGTAMPGNKVRSIEELANICYRVYLNKSDQIKKDNILEYIDISKEKVIMEHIEETIDVY